jgi:hypothetical protein
MPKSRHTRSPAPGGASSLPAAATAEFQLSEREFARGLTLVARRNRRLMTVGAAGPLLVVLGILGGVVVVVVAGAVLSLSFAFMWFANPRMQWRRNPRRTDNQKFTFDARGVRVVTTTTRAEVQWSYYAEILESRDLYVMLDTSKRCNILPRRAFAAADEEAFRRIVSEQREAGVLKAD